MDIKEKKLKILYENFSRDKKYDQKVKKRKDENINSRIEEQVSEGVMHDARFPCCSQIFYYDWKVSQVNGSEI